MINYPVLIEKHIDEVLPLTIDCMPPNLVDIYIDSTKIVLADGFDVLLTQKKLTGGGIGEHVYYHAEKLEFIIPGNGGTHAALAGVYCRCLFDESAGADVSIVNQRTFRSLTVKGARMTAMEKTIHGNYYCRFRLYENQ